MTSHNPSSIAQKNECLKNLKQLNRTLKLAEKDVYMNVSSVRNDKEFQTAFETNLTNDSNHKNQKNELLQQLRSISKSIKKFKHESTTTKPSQQVLDFLKSFMEEIDSSMSSLKEKNLFKYEEYLNDEKLLTKEIEIYDKKIQAWSSQNDNQPLKPTNQNDVNTKLSECDLLKEVIDFDKFLLQNGGHNGGWEEIDHNLFLKIRNKHKTKSELYFDELERLIVTKTREQINQHEDWYINYLTLKELKKEAIKKWRDEKKIIKNETVSLADAELKLNQEIEKELKHRMEKQKQLDKQQRNKQLNEWRIEREIKKAKQLQQVKMKELKQYEKEMKDQLKKAEIKEKLQEYKIQKAELNEYIEMEQFLLQEAEKEARSRDIKTIITNFQERDFEKVREKQEKQKAKQEAELEKQKRLEKLKEKIQVNNDPARLFKPTSTWQNRVNTPRTESLNSALNIPRVQHLMVPNWRQGV